VKHLKMIALAAITTAALTAIVGIASASAATLCSNSGIGGACASGQAYTGAFDAQLKPGTTVTLTGYYPMSCTSSTMSGEVTGSSPIVGRLNSLTLAGCSVFGFGCTFKSVNTPYKVTASGAGGNGTVNVSSGGSGNPGFTSTCFGVSCEFQTGAGGATFAFEGSATEPRLTANRVPLTVTKGPAETCGSTATMNATYTVTNPTSLWIF
jgi:hypothetical protein